MKRLLHIFRFSFISPEFLFVMIFGLLWFIEFSLFVDLVNLIKTDEEIWKYFLTLPAILAGVIFAASSKIRAPLVNKSNKELYDWPGYEQLLDSIFVSFSIAILCFVTCVATLLFRLKFESLTLGMLFLGSLVILGVCALTLFLAKQKIREIMEQFGQQ
jgi:hypothetical protein